MHRDRIGRRRDRQRIVRDDTAQRVVQQQQARASGVHDPGLLQDRQLLGREGQRVLGTVARRANEFDQGLAVGAGPFGRRASDGEHRAFDDAHDRLACQDVSVLEGLGQQVGRDVTVDREFRYQSAKHLREDHPGVAPRAHQRPVGDGLADLGHLGVVAQRSEFGGDGLDGERHIGPGIAVGHRIDVQAIDDILMGSQ